MGDGFRVHLKNYSKAKPGQHEGCLHIAQAIWKTVLGSLEKNYKRKVVVGATWCLEKRVVER